MGSGIAGLGLIVAALCGGCSDQKINTVVVKLFEPRRTPQQQMVVAFAAEDADLRRAALAKVAQSKQKDRDWALRGYVAIARLDTDPQSRCVAIRALAQTNDPRAVEVVLMLLNYREYPPEEVRPPDPLTRWDATEALANLSERGAIPEEQRERARTTLIEHLRTDSQRHARIAAARGLGVYPHEDSVRALIERLSDEDFAVVHQCETSLVRLTGQTHNCDAMAWQDWLAQSQSDLFAHADQVPESRRPRYQNRLEKASYDFQQLVHWLVPGRKE